MEPVREVLVVSKNVTVTRLYNRDNRKIHVGLGIIRLRRTVTSSHGVAQRELHMRFAVSAPALR